VSHPVTLSLSKRDRQQHTCRATIPAQTTTAVRSYWVYMLLCSDGTYYTGVTGNIETRLAQHHRGFFVTCYTYKRRPLRLVYTAEFASPDEAIFWEKRVKGWSHDKKSALARDDWPEVRRLARASAGDHPSTSSG
jgi:predicted GIY-YIG superfamily endonuclease